MPLAVLPAITTRKPLSCERVKVNWEHPLNTRMILWFVLNEGSGQTVHTICGSRNATGFTGGISWLNGRRGGSLDFDGTGYIDLPDSDTCIVNALTLSVWGKRNTITGAAGVLFATSNFQSTWVYENGNIAVGDAGSGWGKIDSIWTDKTAYHHLVCVVPAVGDSISVLLYFDGVYQGTVPSVRWTGVIQYPTIGIWRSHTAAWMWNGQISEISLWGRVLSSVEVYELYSHPYGTPDNPRLI